MPLHFLLLGAGKKNFLVVDSKVHIKELGCICFSDHKSKFLSLQDIEEHFHELTACLPWSFR